MVLINSDIFFFAKSTGKERDRLFGYYWAIILAYLIVLFLCYTYLNPADSLECYWLDVIG